MSDHLNLAKLQLLYRLYEQANSAKDRAVKFYLSEAKRLGLDDSNQTHCYYGNITSVDYDGIVISWEEYHRNCRTDGGRYTMPWDALADDTYQTYIADLVKTQVTAQNKKAAEQAARERAYKQAQLKQLKAELGE